MLARRCDASPTLQAPSLSPSSSLLLPTATRSSPCGLLLGCCSTPPAILRQPTQLLRAERCPWGHPWYFQQPSSRQPRRVPLWPPLPRRPWSSPRRLLPSFSCSSSCCYARGGGASDGCARLARTTTSSASRSLGRGWRTISSAATRLSRPSSLRISSRIMAGSSPRASRAMARARNCASPSARTGSTLWLTRGQSASKTRSRRCTSPLRCSRQRMQCTSWTQRPTAARRWAGLSRRPTT
mmetsp:Transcript_19279/g.57123  ORF Transcript_19279/g.57123 Transcript_19279/m.57123 type:complete len:240 (-) Transcript_19279:1264-1983(-)